MNQQASLRVMQGRKCEALELINKVARLLRQNGLHTETAYCLDALACIALLTGDADTAADAALVANTE